MASRPLFQACILVFGIIYLAHFVDIATELASNSYFPAPLVRFDVLEVRSDIPPTSAGLVSFGFLLDGCHVPAINLSWTPASVIALAPNGRPVNGYYFVTAPANLSGLYPVRWLVEASADNGRSWTAISASYLRRTYQTSATEYILPGIRFNYPLGHDAQSHGLTVEVDQRPPVVLWGIFGVGTYLNTSVMLWAVAIAGYLGRAPLAYPIVTASLSFEAVALAAVSGGYVLLGMHLESVEMALRVPDCVVLVLGIVLMERNLFHVILLYSALFLGLSLAQEALYKPLSDCAGVAFILSAAWVVGPFVVGAFALRAVRAVEKRRAHTLTAGDAMHYDASWREVISSPGADTKIQELSQLALVVSARSKTVCSSPRQLNRFVSTKAALLEPTLTMMRRYTSFYKRLIGTSIAGNNEGTGQPVDSLDQLYVQAVCIHPILLGKVQQWALASGGCFAVADEQGCVTDFAKWTPTPSGDLGGGSFHWAKIKAVDRAVEKAVRSYGKVDFDPCSTAWSAVEPFGRESIFNFQIILNLKPNH